MPTEKIGNFSRFLHFKLLQFSAWLNSNCTLSKKSLTRYLLRTIPQKMSRNCKSGTRISNTYYGSTR